MKTMTFSGRTMREAIAQAKARFGGEVDILDSGAVGDEVHVTVVVPMARSARRRQAIAQVSASINALAARNPAPASRATTPVAVPAAQAAATAVDAVASAAASGAGVPAAAPGTAAVPATAAAATVAAPAGAAASQGTTALQGTAASQGTVSSQGMPASQGAADARRAAAPQHAGAAQGTVPVSGADAAKARGAMPAQMAGDMNSAGAAVPAEQEASAGRKKAAPRTVKGRRKRGAETALAANDGISRVLAAAGQDASAPVPEYLAAAVNSVTLAAANDEMASEPIASVQKGERLDTAALQVAAPQASEPEAAGPNVSVHEAIAQESAVQTPVVQEAVAQFPVAQGAVPRAPAATLPDIAAGMPLSTLDFQRMREQQRAEKQAGATTGAQGQGTGVQAADAALTGQAGAGIAQPGIAQAPMTQAGIAQAGMPEAGSALAGAAQMGIAGAAAVPNVDAAAIQAPVVPDFSALLEQQRQGIPIDLSALQMPGQGAGAVVMKQPQAAGAAVSSVVPQAALNAGQAPSVVGSQTNNAQAAAEHAARQPRSRLWQMVESARRMLGMGRSRRGLWIEGESTGATTGAQNTQGAVAGASAQGAVAGMAGFGEASPLSLGSTLNPSAGDWPSIVLPSDLLGTDGLQGLRSATQAPVGPGWFETTRRRPGQMRLLRHLMGCHFSPSLARTLVELLPADFGDMQADEWLRQMLMRALASVNRGAGQVVDGDRTLFDEGGVFALIGPTGVGKTTSIAKIAAHHVLRHGPRSLALITADVYRIGAQEQLRAFGRMLGVPVQVAQDRDTLQHLLKEHEQSRLVLIDTAGIGQRDERVTQLTSALEVSQVRRVLVMNAAAQPGSIEEVLGAFGARETSGVLLSKVDEAVGLGACLDALIRHRLPLLGYADGQRVPEDYHAVNFSHLIGLALDRKTVARFPALKMTDSELRNLFEDAHV